LDHLLAFWVRFSPLSAWSAPIEDAVPLFRGVRPSKGVRLAGRRASCAAEMVVKAAREAFERLDSNQNFERLSFLLLSRRDNLLPVTEDSTEWYYAVRKYLVDESLGRPLGADASPGGRVRPRDAIYRELVTDADFLPAMRALSPEPCIALR